MSEAETGLPTSGSRQIELLFVRHEAAIRAFVRALVPSLNDADDVMQETFLAVAEKSSAFVEGTNFVAWACAIARFKVLEHLRKRKRSTALTEEAVAALADDAPSQEAIRQREAALAKCLERIAPKSRNLIWRRYSLRQTSDDIGAEVGMTATAVRQALFKVRRFLRDCVSTQIQMQS